MKKFLSAFVILAAIVTIAVPAFAGTVIVANNKMAAELVGPTNNVSVNPLTVGFSGVSAVPNTTISFALANGLWDTTTQLFICLGAVVQGNMAAPSGVVGAKVTVPLAAGISLSPGTTYTVQQGACAASPVALNSILVAKGSTVGQSVQLTIDNAAFSDPGILSVAAIVTLTNQFAASLTAGSAVINFPAFNAFSANTPATLTVTSDESLNQKVVVDYTSQAACGASAFVGLVHVGTGLDTFPVKVTGNLTGLGTFVYNSVLDAGAFNVYTITAADVTNGFATLTVQGAHLCISQLGHAAGFPVAVTAAGTVAMSGTPLTAQGTLAGSTTTNVVGDIGQNYARVVVPAGTAFYSFTFNASSWIIPQLSTNTAVETLCLINNEQVAATPAAPVTVDIVSSEAGTVQAGLAVGTVAPLTSKMLTFLGNTVAFADGSGTPQTITVLGNNARYAGQLNVQALSGSVTVNCIQTAPGTGDKRLVPIYPGKVGTTTTW